MISADAIPIEKTPTTNLSQIRSAVKMVWVRKTGLVMFCSMSRYREKKFPRALRRARDLHMDASEIPEDMFGRLGTFTDWTVVGAVTKQLEDAKIDREDYEIAC